MLFLLRLRQLCKILELKSLIWSVICSVIDHLLPKVTYGSLDIPPLHTRLILKLALYNAFFTILKNILSSEATKRVNFHV